MKRKLMYRTKSVLLAGLMSLIMAATADAADTAFKLGLKGGNYTYGSGQTEVQYELTLTATGDVAAKDMVSWDVNVDFTADTTGVIDVRDEDQTPVTMKFEPSTDAHAIADETCFGFYLSDGEAQVSLYDLMYYTTYLKGIEDGATVTLGTITVKVDSEKADALLDAGTKSFSIPVTVSGAEWYAKGTLEDYVGNVVAGAGAFTISKEFNAQAAVASFDWDQDTSYTVAADAFTFTDKDGKTVNGVVTGLNEAKAITLTVDDEIVEFTEEYGKIEFVEGAFVWNAETADRAVVKHSQLTINVPFLAKDENGVYSDGNTLTITVNPVNQKPVISDFAIVNDAEFGMKETSKVKFTCLVVDPEGDECTADSVILAVGDNTMILEGTFAPEVAERRAAERGTKWVFTGKDVLSQDLVSHTVETRNADNVFVLPWSISFSFLDVENRAEYTATNTEDKATWLTDVDRAPAAPSFTSLLPAAPKTTDDLTVTIADNGDPDGDAIVGYAYTWKAGDKIVSHQNGVTDTLAASETKKGEAWTVDVKAVTTPYGADVTSTTVTSDAITVLNSTPAIAGKDSLFIRKIDGQETATGEITFTVTDADEDDFTVTASDATKGTVEAVKNGKNFTVTYSVTDLATAFEDGSFKVKVNDGEEDSNEITVTVTFKENPLPEIEVVSAPEAEIPEVDADGNASAFSAKISVSDSEEVKPYGIKSIKWTVKDGEGLTITSSAEKSNEADAAGNYPAADEMEINAATLGYETLQGADRAYSGKFVVEVEVTDALNATSTKEIEITVADVDRAPSAPVVAFDVVADGASLVRKSKLNASIVTEAVDPDGDEVVYEGALKVTYGNELVKSEDFAEMDGTRYVWPYSDSEFYLKKGDLAIFNARAKSSPAYEDAEAKYTDAEAAAELPAIGNTKPRFAKFNDVEIADDKAVWNLAEIVADDAAAATVAVTIEDGDVDDGRDTITDVVFATGLDEKYGKASYLSTEGLVVTLDCALVKYFNSFDTDETPSFAITVKDETAASEADLAVELNVTEENNAPALKAQDVYILPDQLGTEVKATIEASTLGDAYEDLGGKQELAEVVDFEVVEGDDLFAVAPSAEILDGKVILTMQLKEDAPLGTKAVFSFAAKDNGTTAGESDGKTSEAITVTVYTGATPWYPIYTLACDEHAMHQVVLTAGDESYTLVVEGNQLKPADYYYQGCKGLKSNTTYDVAIYEWTAEAGAAEEICATDSLTVSEYAAPEASQVKVTDNGDNTFALSLPLAASYAVTLKSEDNLDKVIAKDLVPNENGIILPNDTLDLNGLEEGTYTASISLKNPEGESASSEEFTVTITEEKPFAWPEDGTFTPDSKIIYLEKGKSATVVNFTWPVVPAAEGYVLCVQNAAANFYTEVETPFNTEGVSLSVSADVSSFNWWVVAKNAEDEEITSGSNAFQMVKLNANNVAACVSANGTKLVIDFAVEKKPSRIDIQLAHLIDAENVTWYNFCGSDCVKEENIEMNGTQAIIDLSAIIPDVELAKNDVVYLSFYWGGAADKYKIYVVK